MLENIQFIICLEKYFKFQIILKKTFLKINVYKKNIENEKLNIFKIKDFFINNKIKNIVKNINYYIDNFKKIQYQKISIFKNKYNFYIKNFFFKNKIKMDFNKNNIFYCFNKKIFIINLEKNVFNLFSFKIKYIQYIIKINFLNNFFFKTNNISFLNDNCFILLKRKINFFCLKENVNCFLKLNQILILLLNIKKKKKKFFYF
ncbi:hypothetical protein [Candidatus Carsonella ruddii]|uniref:hypothetical protein n=1 Tax=Carsonella ruddii TaxID=114186 RepID=UPI003D9A80D0